MKMKIQSHYDIYSKPLYGNTKDPVPSQVHKRFDYLRQGKTRQDNDVHSMALENAGNVC